MDRLPVHFEMPKTGAVVGPTLSNQPFYMDMSIMDIKSNFQLQQVQNHLNPGTSGYALDEGKRRRTHNLYQVRDGRLQNIERFAYTSGGFKAEVPEAYATKG